MPDFQTLLLFLGAAVPLAYDVVRWAGGAYLIALGARALFRPLFFLAFIPQFVDPARGRATGWLRRRDRQARLLQRITGGVFVGLGLRLAAAGRR